jgi:hypothetical protein
MLAGVRTPPQRPNIDGIPPARANSIEDGGEINASCGSMVAKSTTPDNRRIPDAISLRDY